MIPLITPNWSAPENVKACSTTRTGGVSNGVYSSLNLGTHVNDDIQLVLQNRALISQAANLPSDPVWLEQIHSTKVLQLTTPYISDSTADAAYTNQPSIVCTVMTADCLPVLFCSQDGDEVAVAHAGWRGLCDGILENTLACFRAEPANILAWFGPAIGAKAFEVGAEIREQFMQYDQQAIDAFTPMGNGKYLANIYHLARQRLERRGVNAIYGGDFCTFSDHERFFSYRRDKQTGRMASLIWLA